MDRRAFLGLCAGVVVAPGLAARRSRERLWRDPVVDERIYRASQGVPLRASGSWVSVVGPNGVVTRISPVGLACSGRQGSQIFNRFQTDRDAFVLPDSVDIYWMPRD